MATPAHTMTPLPELCGAVSAWVSSVRELTQPAAVYWCEGTEAEARELTAGLLRTGELLALNAARFPGCHLYRSDPSDVARVEHLTYHLHALAGGCRPQQPLDGAAGRAREDARAVRAAACAGARCTWSPTAWARSTRRCRAAASRSPTAPTSSSTC